MKADGGGGNTIVQICMRDVVQREQGKMPSFCELFQLRVSYPQPLVLL